MARISIIIPTYNTEKYIERCLKSILSQSFTDFEILVIDDGSSDRTGEIVQKYVKQDKRIVYVKQKHMGTGKARNSGLELAQGELIAFIDSDDYVDIDYLEKLLPHNREDIVFSGYIRPNQNGKIVEKVELKNGFGSRLAVPTVWAKIYRKDFIAKNKLKFLDTDIGEDVWFNFMAALYAQNVKSLNYAGYYWYFNRSSVINKKYKSYKEINSILNSLDMCFSELKNRGLLKENYKWTEFIFYLFIVSFLLSAAKGAKKSEIDEAYNNYFGWMAKRFPNYKENNVLKGPSLNTVKLGSIGYKTFFIFQRIGLGKFLVWISSKV